VGKSTIIQKILLAHPEWKVGGFYTVTRWKNDLGSIHLLSAAKAESCNADNLVGLHQKGSAKVLTYPERFDALAVHAAAPDADLLVMDELGFMESRAERFCQTVLEQLDGTIPVLGVIKPLPCPWLEKIRNHPAVHLWGITAETRNSQIALIERTVAEQMKKENER